MTLAAGVVTPGRFELPTRSLGNCCSIHLSYGATFRTNGLRHEEYQCRNHRVALWDIQLPVQVFDVG